MSPLWPTTAGYETRVLFAAALNLDPHDLIRVDVPDYPGAVVTSSRGSMLLEPPTDGTPWRHAPVVVPDEQVVAHEALDALNVAPWHLAGIDGSGIKVAVFDIQWFGAELHEEELGTFFTHDCRTQRSCEEPLDTLRPLFAFETGQHGVACAEVIHDIAPGAELHLVRVAGITGLENAAEWAIREGIDLISMSLSYFNESFYDGTGAVGRVVDDLAAAGVLLVSSAGNYGTQFHPDIWSDANIDDIHEFPWGSDYLPVNLPEGETRAYLSWDRFGAECGTVDLDIYAYDTNGNLRGRSTDRQGDDAERNRCEPHERVSIQVEEAGWHYLLVHRVAGVVDHLPLKFFMRSGTVFRADPRGAIVDPASHPNTFAVGAVNASGYLENPVQSYSSQGPTPDGVIKPDILGPDGLTTRTYGQRGFSGTSAATPSVAGALALIMSADPTLTPYEARWELGSHGWEMSPAWAEPQSEAGLARLPDPIRTDGGCGGWQLSVALPGLLWGWRRWRCTVVV